jgi:leucyl-tRNA synthetase
VCEDEPFKKLINQGMIQGRSNFVYRIKNGWWAELLLSEKINSEFEPTFRKEYHDFDFINENNKIAIEIVSKNNSVKSRLKKIKAISEEKGYRLFIAFSSDIISDICDILDRINSFIQDKNKIYDEYQKHNDKDYFVSLNLKDNYETTPLHVDVNIVHNDRLDIDKFRTWNPDYADAEFILENGEYICGWAIEKMSKSMYNVVNPDLVCEQYGADTLRMYEMFLGPLEQSKPWDMNGIDGVHRFLRKFWRLFHSRESFEVSDEQPSPKELKVLHKLIKKVQDDMENFSFNTTVSAFMISVNELGELKCNKRAILEPLAILLSPFAPHITEELWTLLGHTPSIANAIFPIYNAAYTVEDSFEYPVSFNGKLKFKKELALNLSPADIEKAVLADEQALKHLAGNSPKKVVVVPGKIINIVV